MPIYHSKRFRESPLAHELLDGLKGLEIGGAAHNAFGLDTVNVDRVRHTDLAFEPYALEQVRLCGEVMPVDIVAPGDCIPVADQSYDFVISSHVIEHFYDPISAIKEWMRIATKYIYITCPHRDALESDKEKPLTDLNEHRLRYSVLSGQLPSIEDFAAATGFEYVGVPTIAENYQTDDHHSRWTPQAFWTMCEWICSQPWGEGWTIDTIQPVDDKVGNGFTVVLKRVFFAGTPSPELSKDFIEKHKK